MVMKAPNIILINADDLGYGDLGCFGSPVHRTPNLDRMAAEGVRLTEFYASASVCTPSRASLMTGCYPGRVSMDRGGVLFPGDAWGLHPDERTVADVLRDAGYATKLVGKWHLGDQPEFLPTRHGFDSYFGLPYSNDMVPDLSTMCPHRFPPLPLMREEGVVETEPDQSTLTDRYLAESMHFIDQSMERERPFFLYLAHLYVHAPIHAQKRFLMESKNGRYGAAVAHIDAGVGILLDHLERCGAADNTLVIFTSDNGANNWSGGSNVPLRGHKGTTWEGGFRVPCICRWPAGFPQGTTCTAVTTMMDIVPTLAALADAEIPDDRIIDGRDIAPLLRGETSESPHDAFYYYCGGELSAVRSGPWKLHVSRGGKVVRELYNLQKDEGESLNVYDSNPEIVKKLEGLMKTCREDIGDTSTENEGRNRRPVGQVENPEPLTSVDTLDPYLRMMYDLDEGY